MRFLLIGVLCLFSLKAYAYTECQAFKIDTEIHSDHRTTVSAYVNKPNTLLNVRIYYGAYEVLGSNLTKSQHDGFFIVDVRTKRRPSLRPDVRVFCK